MIRRAVLTAALLAACGEGTVVEVEPVPADYTGWHRVDTTGALPAHGDTYRIIYVNEEARRFGVRQEDGVIPYQYPLGTILVKEVRELAGDGPGAINYVAVMRKMSAGDAPDGAELHTANPFQEGASGWLFTYLAEDITSEEEYRPSCWESCHAAAPLDGAFLDYGE